MLKVNIMLTYLTKMHTLTTLNENHDYTWMSCSSEEHFNVLYIYTPSKISFFTIFKSYYFGLGLNRMSQGFGMICWMMYTHQISLFIQEEVENLHICKSIPTLVFLVLSRSFSVRLTPALSTCLGFFIYLI